MFSTRELTPCGLSTDAVRNISQEVLSILVTPTEEKLKEHFLQLKILVDTLLSAQSVEEFASVYTQLSVQFQRKISWLDTNGYSETVQLITCLLNCLTNIIDIDSQPADRLMPTPIILPQHRPLIEKHIKKYIIHLLREPVTDRGSSYRMLVFNIGRTTDSFELGMVLGLLLDTLQLNNNENLSTQIDEPGISESCTATEFIKKLIGKITKLFSSQINFAKEKLQPRQKVFMDEVLSRLSNPYNLRTRCHYVPSQSPLHPRLATSGSTLDNSPGRLRRKKLF